MGLSELPKEPGMGIEKRTVCDWFFLESVIELECNAYYTSCVFVERKLLCYLFSPCLDFKLFSYSSSPETESTWSLSLSNPAYESI